MSGAKISSIAKNTSYFTFALILQKVLSFTYFTLIARALGPDDLGKYYLAISLTTIFAIFIDLGLANVLTREIARHKERARELLGSVLAIKLPLAAVSLLGAVLLINLMGYPDLVKDLVYISIIPMVLDSFSLSFFSAIRGFHNLLFESVSSVVFQIIVLTFGLTALYSGLGLRWLMAALAAASIFNFLYSLFLVRFRWKIKISPVFDKKLIKLILAITVPFAIFSIFQRIYTYLDTVLLSLLAGDKYVGLYQVAFKIIFALQFLPLAFVASVYPAFASYWKNNRNQLAITFERAMNYLIIISLPISAGIIVLADDIVFLFKEGFAEAVLPLRLIMVSLPFIFLNFPIGSLLNACDRQKQNTKNMGAALSVSVALNLILIPKFQTVGASVTVIAANLTMFALGMSQAPKIIPFHARKIIIVSLKSLLAAAIMASAVVYLKQFLNIFLVSGIGGALYFAALFLLGGFKKEDITSVWKAFGKR